MNAIPTRHGEVWLFLDDHNLTATLSPDEARALALDLVRSANDAEAGVQDGFRVV